jgi:hypothetical protein
MNANELFPESKKLQRFSEDAISSWVDILTLLFPESQIDSVEDNSRDAPSAIQLLPDPRCTAIIPMLVDDTRHLDKSERDWV